VKKSRVYATWSIAVIIAVGGVTYSQLNWWGKGLVVGFFLAEDWPLAWGAKRNFKNHRSDLESLMKFFDENPEIEQVSLSPMSSTGLYADIQDGPKYQELEDADLKHSLAEVFVIMAFRVDRGVLFYLRQEERSQTAFRIAYVKQNSGATHVPNCGSIDPSEPIGGCDLVLDDSWVIYYEWNPSNSEAIEKILGRKAA
jgi:hypothetical protein